MPTVVSDIVRVYRANDPRMDITGLLVFDGGRFCQYLEGSESAVRELANKIADDEWHINFTVKHEGSKRPRPAALRQMGHGLCVDGRSRGRDLPITLLPQLDLGADSRGR